jgi:hypothetical protein
VLDSRHAVKQVDRLLGNTDVFRQHALSRESSATYDGMAQGKPPSEHPAAA